MRKNKYDWVSNQEMINLDGDVPKVSSYVDNPISSISGGDMAINSAVAAPAGSVEAASIGDGAAGAASGMSGAGMAAGMAGKVIAAGIQATAAQRAARLKSRQDQALSVAAAMAGLGSGV